MSKVFAVGIGPGGAEFMTLQAQLALEQADVLCGYTVYVDLVKERFPDKETYTTPMRQELDRCRWALETAAQGRTVALVCSGDAGVYGMAGPLLQLGEAFPDVEAEIAPGVTAALSGAALLGAPLGHDFCVISLSDLLTPGRLLKNAWNVPPRGIFPSVSIIPPRKSGRTTCKMPAISCCVTKVRIRCAAGCGISGGREKHRNCSLWPG